MPILTAITIKTALFGDTQRTETRFMSTRITSANSQCGTEISTERLGLEEKGGLVRVGLTHYNTQAEIDRLVTTM